MAPEAGAEVRLPKVFGDHMVLQQQKPLPVWGWADPGESVEIRLATVSASAKANARGEWATTLPALPAGGPYTLTVSGSSTLRRDDVLIGEVWLCSGQSNMEMGIASCDRGPEEIAAANHPGIRLLMVPNRWTPMPQEDMDGIWKVCSPTNVADGGWGGFSAAAYYFGRELHQKLKVPIGLIDATWGGTRIESWTPPEGFASVPALAEQSRRVELGNPRSEVHRLRANEFADEAARWLEAARRAIRDQIPIPAYPTFPEELHPPRDVQHPTALYNGMLHPLKPFALRGAIWYQGESNSSEGRLYTERTRALVAGWRTVWQDNSLAYYFTQIAPYNYGGNPETIAEFWEAQAAAQSIPGTGMIVINDIGDLKDIHPRNKHDVGRRLAAWALAKTYQLPGIPFESPTLESIKPEGPTLRVTFRNAEGLRTRDGKAPTWFEIIDADEGGFEPAEAKLDGPSVVLSSPLVPRPIAVRFAWSMLAEPNLQNAAGLPIGAFRGGDLPQRDLLALKVREARGYEVVYDLDLTRLGNGSAIPYTTNRSREISNAFDRVAYFLELGTGHGQTEFVYVSMDAFTERPELLGVPSAGSGTRWQHSVKGLHVQTSTPGVPTGSLQEAGNLEFWPNNYGTENAAGVAGASASVYDTGDQPIGPEEGYGSMQIHLSGRRQTLLAINHWREGARADVGIGNQATGNPDWTFAANAGKYPVRRLRILVRPVR